MSPRQARAEATRQSIIDAAVDLFGEVGYGETDMIDVIERAGTTKGTCYYYFPTRESLAVAVIEQARDRYAVAIADSQTPGSTPLRNLITASFRFTALTESDPLVRVGYQLCQAGRQVSEAGAESYAGIAQQTATALKKAVAEGELRGGTDAAEAAHAILSGVVGSRLFCDATGGDGVGRLTDVWRTFLRGLASEEHAMGLNRFVRSEARKAGRFPKIAP